MSKPPAWPQTPVRVSQLVQGLLSSSAPYASVRLTSRFLLHKGFVVLGNLRVFALESRVIPTCHSGIPSRIICITVVSSGLKWPPQGPSPGRHQLPMSTLVFCQPSHPKPCYSSPHLPSRPRSNLSSPHTHSGHQACSNLSSFSTPLAWYATTPAGFMF